MKADLMADWMELKRVVQMVGSKVVMKVDLMVLWMAEMKVVMRADWKVLRMDL